ncbi:MAG: TVP38/TMEM64 family protein [Planctomycetaceae bacterium]
MTTDNTVPTELAAGAPRPTWSPVRVVILLVVAAAVCTAGYFLRDYLTLSALAAREAQFRQFQVNHPVAVYLVAFFIYVAVTGASLPGATPMTLVFAWLFGFWRALLLVSFASTAGASIAFLTSRYLLRSAVESRFAKQVKSFNELIEREGGFYLFTLRLIPLVPFFVINLAMGLTSLPLWQFWVVSQIGMLPGTAVYVYAGASVPDLTTLSKQGVSGIITPQLLVAFILLGLFPLLIKQLSKSALFQRPSLPGSDAENSETT